MERARSSLAAEAISLGNGIDCLQWTRVYFYEVLYGELVHQFIIPPDQFPLQTPFRKCMVTDGPEPTDVPVWCTYCETSGRVNMNQVRMDYRAITDDDIDSRRIRAIALTDCSDAYASVSSISDNSNDRSMRIVLSYIRDSAPNMRLSFLGECFNLADVATKLYGSRGIYHHFVRTGCLQIFFPWP